jgi:hypothetical protein
MQGLSRVLRRSIRILAWTFVGALAAVVCLEGAIELVLRYPQAAPSLFRPANRVSHLKNYYLGFDRSVIQLRRDCAMYDDRLTYRLRPGSCTIGNRESTVEYAVNRAGLRDTDDKLTDPAIIVLGDSQAMGWGIPGDATLASRLGALTGRGVLNAAISSYETARETELLAELIRPATQYIVIAYCDNDYYDNWGFAVRGVLPHRDRASYEQLVSDHERSIGYYPFKHLWQLGRSVLRSWLDHEVPRDFLEKPGFAAMTFLAILDSHRDLLRGRHLIVFEANSFNQNSPHFATALRTAAARTGLLGELASMDVIDTSAFLTDDDYFLIDDHMRPSGHDKIAHALAEIVGGATRWRVAPSADAVVANATSASGGQIDVVEHKAALTVIHGWAARRDTGEPAATVALLRDGQKAAEAEPVFARADVVAALGKPSATYSGYALAVNSERLSGARTLDVVGIWPDGSIKPLENTQRLRDK